MRAPGSRFSASVGKVVAISVAVPAMSRGVMVSRLSCLELHRDAVLQPAGADLRSLQIAQNANRLAFFARDLAHHFDQLELLRMGAVGEVQPGDIEPGADSSRKTASVLQEGPRVATILARRRLLRGKGYSIPSG